MNAGRLAGDQGRRRKVIYLVIHSFPSDETPTIMPGFHKSYKVAETWARLYQRNDSHRNGEHRYTVAAFDETEDHEENYGSAPRRG
jgi:hypothetical protein